MEGSTSTVGHVHFIVREYCSYTAVDYTDLHITHAKPTVVNYD